MAPSGSMKTETSTLPEHKGQVALCAALEFIWKKGRIDLTVSGRTIRKSGNSGCTDAAKIPKPGKCMAGGKCLTT